MGPRRSDPVLPRLGRGVQGGDHRGHPERRARLCVPPGRVDRSVPGSAPPLDRQARQGVQADAHLGRVLARRLRQRDAPAGLRHRVDERETAQGLPAHARGGRATRPPQARARDGSVSLSGRVARGGVLASKGPAALPGAYPLHPRAPERGRLRRGRYPGDHGPQLVGSVRPLGGVSREHVHLADRRRPGLRPEADELPGARADLQERPGEEPPQPADAHRRVREGAPLRAVRGATRADAGARVHPGRPRTSSALPIRSRRKQPRCAI